MAKRSVTFRRNEALRSDTTKRYVQGGRSVTFRHDEALRSGETKRYVKGGRSVTSFKVLEQDGERCL
ncbi:MAG: hypothetical protein LBK00_07165 [Treponema sp.]|nr:hypothetical protein [Treponema sp.]